MDILSCKEWQVPCFCVQKPFDLSCDICSDQKTLDISIVMDIVRKIVGEIKFKGDSVWVRNALAHLIWKFSAYGKALFDNDCKFLTATNLLHHMVKRYKDEFEEGKRSFFQRVLEKDTPAGVHFVGKICAI